MVLHQQYSAPILVAEAITHDVVQGSISNEARVLA